MNKDRGIFSYFEPAILSCEIGMAKPHKEIFELALQKLGLKSEECVFIDDREEHLDTPKSMGFKVIHYKDSEQLIKGFRKLGICI
ncbi:HAD-IA family hydrolase [Candidatus Aenigmatarchaeota archaeon]